MNWTLLAVVLILAMVIGIGAAKGLIKMIFSVLVLIVTVVITTLITPWLSNFLGRVTNWDDALRTKVEKYYEDNDMLLSNGQFEIDNSKFPKILADSIKEEANDVINDGAQKYNDCVIDATTKIIFRAIVYIATFIVLYIILKALGMIFDIISRLPVLNQVNRIGGALVGIVGGLIAIWIFFIIITSVGNTKFGSMVTEEINENAFLTFLYEKNLIQMFIFNLF